MARPAKLTPEVEERILSALRVGTSIAGSAGYAGIDRSTFHRWMERGHPNGTERADARFRAFRARVEQARDEAEVRDITHIAKAAPHDWRAAAWRLERRRPERYGRGAVAETLPDAPREDNSINPAFLTREELDQLRAICAASKERTRRGEKPPR